MTHTIKVVDTGGWQQGKRVLIERKMHLRLTEAERRRHREELKLCSTYLLSKAVNRAGPCVSIYMPTQRRPPDNLQDPIRFRNLVKQAADSLRREHSAGQTGSMLARFHDLAGDADFWNHATDGLAVFGSPDLFRIVHLQRPMPELAIVAASFHVKPLLRIVHGPDRFQVLSINRRDFLVRGQPRHARRDGPGGGGAATAPRAAFSAAPPVSSPAGKQARHH